MWKFVLALSAAAVFGQEPSPKEDVNVIAGPAGAAMWMQQHAGSTAGTIQFIAAEHASGAVMKNAPYSAEAISEHTRTLGDGTRVVNKQTTTTVRDRDGRMRRENSLPALGGAAPRNFITITDPVAKETYFLNPEDRTASKIKMGETMAFRAMPSGNHVREIHESRVQVTVRDENVATATVNALPALPAMPMGGSGAVMMRFDSKNAKTENLGRQTMEGVLVEGTRTTNTIPAGEIGNDRPIVSVSERWYSPELQIVIYSKTSDPQIGESTYRVTNLRRGDPSPELFRIPVEYKLIEGSPAIRVRRKIEEVQVKE